MQRVAELALEVIRIVVAVRRKRGETLADTQLNELGSELELLLHLTQAAISDWHRLYNTGTGGLDHDDHATM